MDLKFLEDTTCNKRKTSSNKLNIFPIYTGAFTVSEMYDKTVIKEDINYISYHLDCPINNETASSTILKNKRSVEVIKSITNNGIDIPERPVILVNTTTDGTEKPIIPITNAMDNFINIGHINNNNNLTSEALPSSTKYIKKPIKNQRTLFSTLKSKPKKCTRLVKIKNTYFKNKKPENNINKKIEIYYDRAKNKCTNSGKILRKIYSDSILNAVSLTRILKKVLAKENLFDDMDNISLNAIYNEDKISDESESSQHTLTRERSISSNNSEFNNTKTPPSVIDVSNYMTIKNINSDDTNRDIKLISSKVNGDKIEHLYKTDIIAVAVARIENASILNYKKESYDISGRENLIIKDSLTSAESYLSQAATESSRTSFEKHSLRKESHLTTIDISDSSVSSQTLTESQFIFDITSESDKFAIAKTSSDFRNDLRNDLRNDHLDSNITLTPLVGLKTECDLQQPKLLKSTLLDTIININMFPKMTTSIYDNLHNAELKDVIIIEELGNSLPLNRLDKDCTNENRYSKSILRKSYNAEDDSNRQKSFNLPNEETVKDLLFNRNQAEKKSCSEEYRNYTPFSELWDKLTIFLDLAMKRLENVITDKITQEMGKALDRLNRYINISVGDSKVSKSETYIKKEPQETHIIRTRESGESKSLQCGTIQNNVLDELVKKINLQGLKAYKSPSLRLKDKCHISNDLFEVLKPTLAPRISNEKGNGDSFVASSSEGIEVKYSKLQHVPLLMVTIFQVVKENLLVIISVPLFCFALFLIYTFLVMLANI